MGHQSAPKLRAPHTFDEARYHQINAEIGQIEQAARKETPTLTAINESLNEVCRRHADHQDELTLALMSMLSCEIYFHHQEMRHREAAR